ncbi:MAG: Na(+)-translocating NADH-quinone reductase subunit C, partial [Thermoguttaceae bacterium]
AAVLLKPLQEENKKLDRMKNVLIAAGLFNEDSKKSDINSLFEQIDSKVVELASGEYIEDIDPDKFDQRKAAKDPKRSSKLTTAQDIAKIKQRSNQRIVYFKRDGDKIERIILPVYGKGLWSTMYGFIALDADLKTVKSFGFYEHGETPGLGGEVDNKNWKAGWVDKLAFDEQGRPTIQVIKGTVQDTDPEAPYKVDGIGGATITCRGVANLVQFWLGQEGYGPLLERLKTGDDNG